MLKTINKPYNMKCLKFIVPACLLLMTNFAQAQQRVARLSAGVTTIYSSTNPFVDAYTDAVVGDTIYLSGGGFTAPTTIDKGIVIFGAGFHLDSTTATFPTTISNSITLGANSDNLYVEGVEFQNINRYSADTANNVSFVRCRMGNFTSTNNGAGQSVGIEFIQNITGTLNLFGITNSVVSNNIITGQIISSVSNLISNNLLKKQGSTYYESLKSVNNCTFTNNVFFHNSTSSFSTSLSGNIFENNVFVLVSPNLGAVPVDNNNYKGIDITTVFVNQSGNVFDYTHDYHLQSAAQTLYLGTDSTEVGLYGGLFPYKEGAVPQNPHISTKTIAPQTTTNGDLNIQNKVNAQNN